MLTYPKTDFMKTTCSNVLYKRVIIMIELQFPESKILIYKLIVFFFVDADVLVDNNSQ